MRISNEIATPDGKRRYVRVAVSRRLPTATISSRVLLSYGQDRRWKRACRRARPSARRHASRSTSRRAPATSRSASAAGGARVVGLDITPRMIELASRKRRAATASRGSSSATCWRCRSRSTSFDVVTTGYGLRNVPDLAAAVDEIARVLRPGGVVVSLDFNRPANRSSSRGLSHVSDGRGRRARLAPAPRSRYVPLHLRRRFAATRAPRPSPAMFEARGFEDVRVPSGTRRVDGDTPCDQEGLGLRAQGYGLWTSTRRSGPAKASSPRC